MKFKQKMAAISVPRDLYAHFIRELNPGGNRLLNCGDVAAAMLAFMDLGDTDRTEYSRRYREWRLDRHRGKKPPVPASRPDVVARLDRRGVVYPTAAAGVMP